MICYNCRKVFFKAPWTFPCRYCDGELKPVQVIKRKPGSFTASKKRPEKEVT